MEQPANDGPRDEARAGRVWHTRHEIEDLLIDADKSMMQIVQVALSLIGFGITINGFFNDVAVRTGGASGSVSSRRVGIAMLALGLVYLGAGIAGQAGFRLRAARRLRAYYSTPTLRDALRRPVAPALGLAVALLVLSMFGLVLAVMREFGG